MTTLGPEDDDRYRGSSPPPPPPSYGMGAPSSFGASNIGGYNYGSQKPEPKRGWVKWVVGGVIALVVVMVLGCVGLVWLGNNADDDPVTVPSTPGVTQPVSPAPTTPFDTRIPGVDPLDNPRANEADEYAALNQMRNSNLFADRHTDAVLVNTGYEACSALRANKSLPQIGAEGRSNGLTNSQISTAVTAGAIYLCPDQLSKLPRK